MGLSSALYSALSGLNSQSASISNISNNLSNTGTTGYKRSGVAFASMVSNHMGSPYSTSGGIGAGVKSIVRPAMNAQGATQETRVGSHMAITGPGFFMTRGRLDDTALSYTRDGSFDVNKQGYLVNEHGQYLMGVPTNRSGAVIGSIGAAGNLKPLNVSGLRGPATATANIKITANVPSQGAVGKAYTRDLEVYDSLGNPSIVKSTWTKTAENTWKVTFADPMRNGEKTGTAAGAVTLKFDGKGKLTSTTPSPPVLNISGWKSGADNNAIKLDLNGISQLASTGKDALEVRKVEHDGSQYGTFRHLNVDKNGIVSATFSNGKRFAIFKVPLATFSNPNGLKAIGGNAFQQSTHSGDHTIHSAGTGGAGKLQGSHLERSNVDTGVEMTNLIVANQAYSAAAEVISTTNRLHDTLIGLKR